MTEHVHDWAIWEEETGCCTCVDVNCPVVLTPPQILARLNATERLRVEMARRMIADMESERRICTSRHIGELRTYVGALEEKDG